MSQEFIGAEASQGGGGELDADAIMASIESTGSAPYMSAPQAQATQAAPQQQQQQQQQAQTVQDIEFNWNGKQIKAPITDPRVRQWASQGYDYAQKMADFNRRQQEIASREQELTGRYGAIDEYVRQNPQFWDHVTQEWQKTQLGNQIDPNSPIVKELQTLKSEIGQVKEFKQTLEKERLAIQEQQEDQALAQEIGSIREQYPDIDLAAPDANGTSLEHRVIKHAIDNKLSSFRAAFRDLLHDDLVKRAEDRGKEAVNKELQKRQKSGILGTSPTPTKGSSPLDNIKNLSYEALNELAKQELGIA
jgi:hypothetical protein